MRFQRGCFLSLLGVSFFCAKRKKCRLVKKIPAKKDFANSFYEKFLKPKNQV